MLFNPLDMLRLTFLTGKFGEILFVNGAAVIPPHSFLFSLVGFRGNGIGLQIADVVGNLPYSVAEIGVIGVSGIITANRHLGKPFVFGSFSIVRQTVVYGKVNLQFLFLYPNDQYYRIPGISTVAVVAVKRHKILKNNI